MYFVGSKWAKPKMNSAKIHICKYFKEIQTKINKELQVVDSGQALLDGSDRRNTGSSVP